MRTHNTGTRAWHQAAKKHRHSIQATHDERGVGNKQYGLEEIHPLGVTAGNPCAVFLCSRENVTRRMGTRAFRMPRWFRNELRVELASRGLRDRLRCRRFRNIPRAVVMFVCDHVPRGWTTVMATSRQRTVPYDGHRPRDRILPFFRSSHERIKLRGPGQRKKSRVRYTINIVLQY